MTLRLNKLNKTVSAILGAFVVFTLLVIAANKQAGRQVSLISQAPLANEGQKGVLGESYQAKGYVLTLGDVKSYPIDETTATVRTMTEVVITNNSDTVLQISPGLQMFIIDRDGGPHTVTARYLNVGVTIGGPIGPGETAHINADFDLPADLMANSFVFQKDAASEPTVVSL